MPPSFRQAIAANHVTMKQFLLEDSKVDPNRHCDWIFARDSEVMDNEGKTVCQDKECKGRCTYDVHTEGGGGVEPKEDVVREVA